MSHTIFHTTKMIPMNPPHSKPIPSNKTLSSKIPILPPLLAFGKPLVVSKASVSASSPADALANGDLLDRCFRTMSAPSSSPVMYAPPSMKKDYGAFGAVTLEKSKLDMTQKQTKSSPELATGGGGGDIGKRISHGGGDGGDDGGDDDSYFDDFDDGDDGDEGGLFRRRIIFQELFDRKFVDAVLNEWLKTVMDLPAGFRQAYEMGLVSSAQMVKFLAINARPTTARSISRMLPQGLSRAFIGRMIADPAFLYKLLLEQAATIGCSLWWEVKNRKERIKQEWDLALLNVLTVTACNAIVVWSLAPCRSYGNTFQHDIQNTVQKLPNNIFERSYPLREFDLQKRIHSFIYKFMVLGTVGSTAGAVQAAVSNLASSRKELRLSVTIPSVSTYAVRYGAFLGLYANLRYQLLNGLDRAAVSCFDVIGVPLFFSTALRVLNVQLGEMSRPALLGVDVDQLAQSDLLKAYNRPSESANEPSSSKWLISKKAIVSGLGLLGIKQERSESTTNEGEEEPSPKARRKRIVRKKVASSRV